jgi:hypothetical protein
MRLLDLEKERNRHPLTVLAVKEENRVVDVIKQWEDTMKAGVVANGKFMVSISHR